jgi:Na+-transporting methylmalonyl-CoA/oxaloacetate decarboxylase gamma subunit
MHENTDSSEKHAERAVSLLEKATQFRFALFLVSFTLAVDTALVIFYKVGIARFDPRLVHGGIQSGAVVPVGAMVLFFAVYVFFMAALSPVIQHFVCKAFWELCPYRLAAFFCNEPLERKSYKDRYRNGRVVLGDANKVALQAKDSFWIARINDEESRRQRSIDDRSLTGRVSFSTTLLLLANYFAPNETSLTQATAGWILGLQGFSIVFAFIALLACVVMIVLPWWHWFVRDDVDAHWISHPFLAKQRLQEMEKREDELRAVQAEINGTVRPRRTLRNSGGNTRGGGIID